MRAPPRPRPRSPSLETQLMGASKDNNEPLVKELLKAGANVNARSKAGETALICASAGGHTNIVKALIKANACTDLRNEAGYTALMFAVNRGHIGTIKALLNAKADVNLNLPDGEDILTLQIGQNTDKVISILKQQRLPSSPYTLVNDFIVSKYEGDLEGYDEVPLRTLFNFRARTVTEIIDKNPGAPCHFNQYGPAEMDEIVAAYNWITEQKKSVPHPLKTNKRVPVKLK